MRLLNARVAEHQLNDPNVDAISEQSARAFMPEVVPAEIDPLKLLAIPFGAFSAGLWLDAMCKQPECFPGGLDVRLVRASLRFENVRIGPSVDRRLRIAASRPSGLNGMRRLITASRLPKHRGGPCSELRRRPTRVV